MVFEFLNSKLWKTANFVRFCEGLEKLPLCQIICEPLCELLRIVCEKISRGYVQPAYSASLMVHQVPSKILNTHHWKVPVTVQPRHHHPIQAIPIRFNVLSVEEIT